MTKAEVVDSMHTPAHQCHPWNEMADAICDQVSRRHLNFATNPLPEVVRRMVLGEMGNPAWLHLHIESHERLKAYPPIDADGYMQPWSDSKNGVWALPDGSIVGNIDIDEGMKRGNNIEQVDGGLKIVTFNVQSLRGKVKVKDKDQNPVVKAGFKGPNLTGVSKQTLVLGQLGKRKGHMGGMQEVRSFVTAISMQDGLLLCKSKADSNGAHGCALAFNTKIPWFLVGGKGVHVGRKDLAIELATPRLLCVGLSTVAGRYLCISCHGPLTISKDVTPAVYWANTSKWVQ